MDLHDHSRGRAKAQMRNKAREQFNQQLDVMRRSAAAQEEAAKAQTQQSTTLKEEKSAIIGAFAAKGGISDMAAAAKGAGKGTIESAAKTALESAKAGKSMVESGAKATDQILGEGAADNLKKAAKPVAGAAERTGVAGAIKRRGAKIAESKIGQSIGKAGEKALGHTGAIANIGLAGYDLAEDFKGGNFQLAGDNDAEKVGNALQMGAGVMDAIGFIPGFQGAFVIGAALGAASSAADVIGSAQEGQKEMDTEDKDGEAAQRELESEKVQEANEVVESTTTLASA